MRNPAERAPTGHNHYPQWELAVREAYVKLKEARRMQRALVQAKAENSKRFFIRGTPNDAVNEAHFRFELTPKAREEMVEGVSAVVVRIPVLPVEDAPLACVEGFLRRDGGQPIEDLGEVPTKDIFIEAMAEGGEAQRFLLTPGTDGLVPYSDASGVLPSRPDYQALGQVYEIGTTVTALPEVSLSTPGVLRILSYYEPSQMSNERPSAQTA